MDGVVTNSSVETWTDINVAPFVSRSPITTREALTEAAASEVDATVGDRLTDPGLYSGVGDLAPGAHVPFSLRVPVTSLRITKAPGVYWIGVHALGANTRGRDLVADGRARTFIALVPPLMARRHNIQVSVVLPLRERARRGADGRLAEPARWSDLTRPDGRLGRLVDFGASAGQTPVTWLVDPATLDALDDISRGNPPLSLGLVRTSGGTRTPSSPTTPPTPSATEPPALPADPAPSAAEDTARGTATRVLRAFLATARSHTLFALGYADPDVASLARRRPSLLRRAEQLTASRMKARGLSSTAVVAPPNGFFDATLLPEIPPDALLVLSDHGLLNSPAISRLPSGHRLVLADARASSGGPAPTAPRDPLALRQRILADAALEITESARGSGPTQQPRPLVVTLPRGWDPGPSWTQAAFFSGVRGVGWVQMIPLPRSPTTTYDAPLVYGTAQLSQEIGSANVAAARTLDHTSAVLGELLGGQNAVTDRLSAAALQASSYSARLSPRVVADQVLALDAAARKLMSRVQVTGTDFITLSGGSGSPTVTLVNGLRRPILVGLKARTDSPEVTVVTPKPVRMQPGQRTTLRLQVTNGVGVHDVTLSPMTASGQETGTPLTFSMRTSGVGRLIWYIILAGGALLAVMIARRIALRIRSHRWRQDGTR